MCCRFLSPFRRCITAGMLALGIAAPAAAQAGAPISAPDPAPAASESELNAAINLFQSPDASPEARQTAAWAILQDGRMAAKAALHEGLLADQPPGVRAAAAAAIARHPAPPRDLLPALAAALDPADRAAAPSVLQALGRYRAREAVRPIMLRILSPDSAASPELVSAALGVLRVQTGLEEFGDDPARWRAWWAQAQLLPESEFRLRLADALARQTGELRRQRDELAARLLDTTRRLHASMDDESRQAHLAEILKSEIAELRLLGLELTRRAMLNARKLAEPVVRAVASRLSDPVPAVRASAAAILRTLDRPDLAPSLAAALESESDPAVAEALLGALAQRPQPGTPGVIVRWMESPGPARAEAIRAALALERAGLAADPDQAAAFSAALDRLPDPAWTGAAVSLRARLSGPAAVERFLGSADPALAVAAAEATATDDAGLDRVLRAAGTNPALFETAVRASIRLRPTLPGLAAARALPAPDTRIAESLLADYTRAVPPGELLAEASRTSDPLQRLVLLTPTARADYLAASEGHAERVKLIGLLASTHADLGKPADAADALDLIAADPEAFAFGPLRLTVLLWLGRTDQALAIQQPLPASAWLDGLERALSLPHAAAVREAVAAHLPGPLGPDEQRRFDELSARIPTLRQGGSPPR